ncbi:hypothetical protein [Halomonas salina]|uniref:hypothetical protein n=1 Tax=Halomonas salina TaxID=42565 RepID=UPI000553CD7B|nr:hypothetical protein [Halomonas salina]
MSRKPVHLAAAGPKSDRQAMWETMRRLNAQGEFTVRDVWLVMGPEAPISRPRDYMEGLERAGYIKRSDAPRKPGQPVPFHLARDIGVEAPRVRRNGTELPPPGREQLWRTLKILGDFTAAELADAASTPASPIKRTTAEEYCHYLQQAGYLGITREGSPGIATRYRLIPSRWSGPKAPMIQRTKNLFDPNRGEVVYQHVTHTEGGEA